MFSIPQQVKIFVALEPTDMRRGFNGLSGQVNQTLQQDPLSGHLFLSRNRRKDRLKILYWKTKENKRTCIILAGRKTKKQKQTKKQKDRHYSGGQTWPAQAQRRVDVGRLAGNRGNGYSRSVG